MYRLQGVEKGFLSISKNIDACDNYSYIMFSHNFFPSVLVFCEEQSQARHPHTIGLLLVIEFLNIEQKHFRLKICLL